MSDRFECAMTRGAVLTEFLMRRLAAEYGVRRLPYLDALVEFGTRRSEDYAGAARAMGPR